MPINALPMIINIYLIAHHHTTKIYPRIKIDILSQCDQIFGLGVTKRAANRTFQQWWVVAFAKHRTPPTITVVFLLEC